MGQCSAGRCLPQVPKSPYKGVCSACVGHALLLVRQCSAGQCFTDFPFLSFSVLLDDLGDELGQKNFECVIRPEVRFAGR